MPGLINFKKLTFILTAVLYLGQSIQAAEQGEINKVTIERSYSLTTVQMPSLCRNEKAGKLCKRLSDYFARRFERELILEKSQSVALGQADFTDANIERARQNVFLFFLQNKEAPITTLYALSFQYFTDKPSTRMVETFNFDNESERNLPFSDLFADPDLAAMLLARFIEEHYQQEGSFMLPVLSAVTEYAPRNFIIVEDGLRLFFAPGLVSPDQEQLQSVKVPLAYLQAAGPKERWWPGLVQKEPSA